MKRYTWDVFLCPGFVDLVWSGDVWAMDKPGLSHLQTSPSPVLLVPNAASGSKCSRNQRKFSLSERANSSTSSASAIRFIVSFRCCPSLQAARPSPGQLPPAPGGWSPPRHPPRHPPLPPGRGMAVAGDERRHRSGHLHCLAQAEP